MILTDTGPLVGMVDPADSHHIRSREVLESLTGEMMLTTWPCFTEAMYFLGESESLGDFVTRCFSGTGIAMGNS